MNTIEEALSKYREVFSETAAYRTYRGDPVAIQLQPGIKPKMLKAHPVPFAIKQRVEEEIDRLVDRGILKPVSFSYWASPAFPLINENGSIHIVGDYSSTINQGTKSDIYPIPTASEVYTIISGGRYYSTFDFDNIYTQVVVTDATACLLTLNTCKGLFTLHRLPFNIKGSSGIVFGLMTTLLAGLPGVAVLPDSVIVSGRTMPEMTQRLDAVFEQIAASGLRLDSDKFRFAKPRTKYLGYIIDANCIQPAPSTVELIFNTPQPENIQQLLAFLDVCNFYGRFVPHKHIILEPLHSLFDGSQGWTWTDREQNSFHTIRRLLASDLRLVQYDFNKRLVLTCASSEYGTSAVLSHVMDNNQERTIAISSKALHTYQRRYSQLEKKAMAIMYGVLIFHEYLMGRFFIIVTDHKPLLRILDPKAPIPNVLSPLIVKWILLLNAYNYDLKYKPGSQIGNADGLSRWPQSVQDQPEQQLYDILLLAEPPADFPIDVAQLASATKNDTVLKQVSEYVLCGWPAKISDSQLRPYWLRRTKLSLHKDCIVLGCRVVIPSALRETVIRAFHKAHRDIVTTKLFTRSYVWWPKLNDDIKVLVQNGKKRLENRHLAQNKTFDSSVMPKKPWSRLLIDVAGPFRKKVFLIIVDAYSKWPEVFILSKKTPASVIRHLRMIFATHGLCETLVSSSGASFILSEMKQFLQANKINHVISGIFLPSTNGLAERMVQTIKEKLGKMDGKSLDVQIPNILLGLRATPCTSTNKSPAELLFNRRLRTLATSTGRQRKIRGGQVIKSSNREYEQTDLGNTVMYRNYSTGPRWLSGAIVSKEGPFSYRVEGEDGNLVIRHTDELIRIQTPNTQKSQTEQDNQTQNRYVDIIEIPSSDKWTNLLGMPIQSEPGFSGGGVNKKPAIRGTVSHARPDQKCDFML